MSSQTLSKLHILARSQYTPKTYFVAKRHAASILVLNK